MGWSSGDRLRQTSPIPRSPDGDKNDKNLKAISGIADIHAKGGKVILSYGYVPVEGVWNGGGHGGISAQVKLQMPQHRSIL